MTEPIEPSAERSVEGAVERALVRHFAAQGEEVRVRFDSRGGSSWCRLGIADLTWTSRGRCDRRFVKFGGPGSRADRHDRLASEEAGLKALASFLPAAAPLRTPADVSLVENAADPFLIMEAVPEGSGPTGFFARFGEALAELHRASRGHRFGFDHDNYLGATPQPNEWGDDWVTFFGRHRLGYQLRLVREMDRSSPEMDRLGDRLLDRLGDWLDLPEEPSCLLHGDLWSGNFLVGAGGEAVLIDPAVHFGHRECDLAMTRLFGGFSEAFYRAYETAWPLAAGSADRLEIYQLYHRLNHVVLFGSSYLPGCLETLRRLVG